MRCDGVDARAHAREVGAHGEDATRESFEEHQGASFGHHRREDGQVAAWEQVTQLVVRQVTGEDDAARLGEGRAGGQVDESTCLF